MFRITLNILKTCFLLFILVSCSEDSTDPTNGVDGLDGFNALVSVIDEPVGENCSSGGVRISVGQDVNANGVLDESEITSINFICNGADGNNGSGLLLVARTSPENPGENCSQGGTLVEVGTDLNSNNALDDNEIQTSFFVCNGENGADGSDGTNGTDGSNGLTSLIRVTTSTSCDNGGITIEVGIDDDQNGSLGDGEVDATYDICDGADGTNGSDGYNTLSNVITEPAGSNCPNGGIIVQLGLDTDRNGSLDADEVVSENYVCNGNDGANGSDGSDGSDGLSSIIKVTAEDPGTNCPSGGLMIEIGMDDVTVDGALQNEEVDYTYFVCNGADGSDGANGLDGLNSLIKTSSEDPGANCATGGIQIEIGLDNNNNGVLDEGEEIGSPVYVCNGSNGTNGSDGSDGKSVFVVSENDRSCTNGGVKLTFGYDNNNDGDLVDAGDEILTSHTVCNGSDGTDGADGSNGKNSIIRITAEDPGLNCTNGGTLVQVGIDDNGNNNLEDPAEIDASFYVCNGSDGTDGSNGNNSLISVSSFSGVQGGCTNGGLIIRTGVDDNGNGSLDAGEVDATSYVCDGSDGSNGNDGNSDNIYEFYFQEGFDGYTGVLDVSITDKNPTERGESLSVDRGATDSHGLLLFPDINQKIAEGTGTTEFEVVEAILYLRGSSTPQDGATEDNWIGAKILQPTAPVFTEDGVTWTASGNGDWSLPGVTSRSSDGDAYGYSDMFRLPSAFAFNGFIPLLLSKTEVAAWTDPSTGKDDNKGIVLLMANASVLYELDVFTSNYAKDANYRPTLYIKVKTGVKARSATESDEEYISRWNAMSLREKLAPLHRKTK